MLPPSWISSFFLTVSWGNAHFSFPNMWSQSRTVLGCSELEGPTWGGRKLFLGGLVQPLKAQAPPCHRPSRGLPVAPQRKTCDSSVLVHLGYSKDNHQDQVASKQEKFLSPSLEAGKSKVKVLANRCLATACFLDSHFIALSSHGRRGKRALWGLT